jgi:hypothetical protein
MVAEFWSEITQNEDDHDGEWFMLRKEKMLT